MCGGVVGDLVFIKQIVDKFKFLNILKENLKKDADMLNLPPSFTFQHDNDHKYSANILRMWLMYNISQLLSYPPQSPDVNTMEH